MTRLIFRLLLVLCLALAGMAAADDSQWRWSGVERVVAFGDVHGAYDELVGLLQKIGVIDADLNWAGGRTHLVSVGDLLDRGPHSRKVMDLLIRLQEQAGTADGRVHVLLGNHELMNLTGDLRYVSAQEYEAFADEEPAGQRQRVFEQFIRDRMPDASRGARAEFDEVYPPGYFGLRAAFAPDGRYGRWLLERPVMIVINGTAFAHGGLPPLITTLGLAETNRRLRAELERFVSTWQQLLDENLVPDYLGAHESEQIMENRLPDIGPDLAGLAADFDQSAESDIFDNDGPVWYRGTALCHSLLETSVTASALSSLGADRVVVGHTPTRGRRVRQRLDGRVVMLDTGMLKQYYNGVAAALIIEDDELSIVYATETQPVSQERNDAYFEQFLLEAAIAQQDNSNGTMLLRRGDQTLQAVFRSDRAGREYASEIAAYRVDRMLGLGMVPITVKRDIDGRSYALSLRDDKVINENERIDNGAAIPDWCASGDVYDLMYVFDALLGNEGRTRESILYSGPDLSLQLTRFGRAFGTRSAPPDYLRNIDLELAPELQRRLAALSADALGRELEGFITERQLRALLKRRDYILKKWSR